MNWRVELGLRWSHDDIAVTACAIEKRGDVGPAPEREKVCVIQIASTELISKVGIKQTFVEAIAAAKRLARTRNLPGFKF